MSAWSTLQGCCRSCCRCRKKSPVKETFKKKKSPTTRLPKRPVNITRALFSLAHWGCSADRPRTHRYLSLLHRLAPDRYFSLLIPHTLGLQCRSAKDAPRETRLLNKIGLVMCEMDKQSEGIVYLQKAVASARLSNDRRMLLACVRYSA